MTFVYAIAFCGNKFLMVHNPQRNGWEMPGGKVENGEGPNDAIIREFQEETGQAFEPLESTPHRQGTVFVGLLRHREERGEMRWELFPSLPADLAFPREEYQELLPWAQDVYRSRTRGKESSLKY